MEDPAGGEGVSGACMGHTLPWEIDCRRGQGGGRRRKQKERLLVFRHKETKTMLQKKH